MKKFLISALLALSVLPAVAGVNILIGPPAVIFPAPQYYTCYDDYGPYQCREEAYRIWLYDHPHFDKDRFDRRDNHRR